MRRYVMLCIVFFTMTSCGYSQQLEVGYIFHESTAWTQFMLLNSQEIPIKFEPKSNPEALASLYNLKPSILYANSDGTKIFLIGQYDKGKQTFTLERWYITTPFKELKIVDETKLPHEIIVIERKSLEAKDFHKTDTFDPNHETFDLNRYMEKENEKTDE